MCHQPARPRSVFKSLLTLATEAMDTTITLTSFVESIGRGYICPTLFDTTTALLRDLKGNLSGGIFGNGTWQRRVIA